MGMSCDFCWRHSYGGSSDISSGSYEREDEEVMVNLEKLLRDLRRRGVRLLGSSGGGRGEGALYGLSADSHF